MARANKYFDEQDSAPELPRLRAWKAFRREATVRRVVPEIRKGRDGLMLRTPQLSVSFYGDDDHLLRFDEAPWEPELDDWLIDEEKAKARTVDNEKDRFSLVLKPALRPSIVRYGDGFFNSVLVDTLKQGPFSGHGEVIDMLRAIHEDLPAGGSMYDCKREIEHAFSTAARRLVALYPGERETAEDVLGGAIARYLDDRFSVTNSRLLGLA